MTSHYFICAVGHQAESLATRLLWLLLARLPVGPRRLLALDDTPTKRYGPHVEGAGIHHHPTPAPADGKYVYGHIWVTLVLIGDRRTSPWDDPARRPPHADRRKALRRWILREEYSAIARGWQVPRKIRAVVQKLFNLAG